MRMQIFVTTCSNSSLSGRLLRLPWRILFWSLITVPLVMPQPCRGAEDLDAFIMGLPKAELHVHLEGTLEPELYLAIADRNHLRTAYADAEAVRARLRDALDLNTFIQIYEELISVVRTKADFHDLVVNYGRRASAQGVLYAEIYFDPQLHLERGVPLATIFAGLQSGQQELQKNFGMPVRFIMSFLRDRPADSALVLLEQSRPWRGRFIGVGLDNPEVAGFTDKFRAVFARAALFGLHRTTHCDVGQPDTVANHWGALDVLQVERIDHGLNVLDDPKLIEAVRARRIGLAAAPTLFFRDVPGRMEYRAGAIQKLLDLGLRVTVNSDDPGMKRGLYVGDLMIRVQHTTGMSRADLIQLARNSFDISWLPAAQRDRYLARLDAYAAGGDASGLASGLPRWKQNAAQVAR